MYYLLRLARTAGYCPGELKGRAKKRAKKGARDRRRQKEIIDYVFFASDCLALIPSPQTSPWVTSCQTARVGCRLSSYPPFSRFSPFGIHTVLQPRNHVGTPGKWTEATQMLISPRHPPQDTHHTLSPPSKSLASFFHPSCPKSLKSHWRQQSGSLSPLIGSLSLMEEEREEAADRRGAMYLAAGSKGLTLGMQAGELVATSICSLLL